MKCLPSIEHTLLTLVFLMLTGCGGVPVKSHPVDEHFISTAESQSQIGVHKDVILQKYGKPYWKFKHEKFNYFLYTSAGEIDVMWDIFIPFIVLPGSIYDADYQYCALLKFDQSETIVDVEHASDVYYDVYGGVVPFCMHRLFPENDANLLIRRYEGSPPYIDSSVDESSIALLEIDYSAQNLEIRRISEDEKISHTIFLLHFGVFQKTSKDNEGIFTSFPFRLTPGKYWIRYTLIYGGHRVSDFENNPKYHPTESGFVTLKAGHRYKLKRKSCLFCRSASKSTSWIEDVDTGEVILGSSDMNRPPREDCDKYDPDPLIVCPWWGMNIQR